MKRTRGGALVVLALVGVPFAWADFSVPEKTRSTLRDRPVRLTLRAQDAPAAAEFVFQSVTSGTLGTPRYLSDTEAVVLFKPSTGFEGDASFQYRARTLSDPNVQTDWATFTVKVTKKFIPEIWLPFSCPDPLVFYEPNDHVAPCLPDSVQGETNIEYLLRLLELWGKMTDEVMFIFLTDDPNAIGAWLDPVMAGKPPHLQIFPAFQPWPLLENLSQPPGPGSLQFVEKARWLRSDPNYPSGHTVDELVTFLAQETGSAKVMLESEAYFADGGSERPAYYSPQPTNYVDIDELAYDTKAQCTTIAQYLADCPFIDPATGNPCPRCASCANCQACNDFFADPNACGPAFDIDQDPNTDGNTGIYACNVCRDRAGILYGDPDFCDHVPAFTATGPAPSLEDTVSAFHSAVPVQIWWYHPYVVNNTWTWAACALDLNATTRELVSTLSTVGQDQCMWLGDYSCWPGWRDPNSASYAYDRRGMHMDEITKNNHPENARQMADQMVVGTGYSTAGQYGIWGTQTYPGILDEMQQPEFQNRVSFFIDDAQYWPVGQALLDVLNPDAEPWSAPSCPGDMNCDGVVDFRDIDLFINALGTSRWAWEATTYCPYLNADCNGDGSVTYVDVDPFVARIEQTCP